jgi:pimeloyl-ACP methyl ester carboxylesterase
MPASPKSRLVIAGLLAAVVLTATLLLWVAALPGQSAVRSPLKSESAEKPTIVLVHGVWADSSSWNRVTKYLQQRDYTVYSFPNPLRTLSGDSAYLASFLGTLNGPVILVGHSYGGAVITNAANGNPNVKGLVYIDAFAPDEGETLFQLLAQMPGSALAVPDPTQVFDLVPYPGAPPGDFDAYIKQGLFPSIFANDLPLKKARVLATSQRPGTLSTGTEPSGPPAWKEIPSWFLIGTLDKIIPPAEQEFMAERAGSHIVRVKASHLSMVSRPQDVARLILNAAQSAE